MCPPPRANSVPAEVGDTGQQPQLWRGAEGGLVLAGATLPRGDRTVPRPSHNPGTAPVSPKITAVQSLSGRFVNVKPDNEDRESQRKESAPRNTKFGSGV